MNDAIMNDTALSTMAPGVIERVHEHRVVVAEGLSRLALVLQRRDEVGPATAIAYAEALVDLDPRDLADAFREVARFERWFPPPVVIREYAAESHARRKEREEEAGREEHRRDIARRREAEAEAKRRGA